MIMSGATTVMVVSRTGSIQMNRGLNTDAGFLAVHTFRQDTAFLRYSLICECLGRAHIESTVNLLKHSLL